MRDAPDPERLQGQMPTRILVRAVTTAVFTGLLLLINHFLGFNMAVFIGLAMIAADHIMEGI